MDRTECLLVKGRRQEALEKMSAAETKADRCLREIKITHLHGLDGIEGLNIVAARQALNELEKAVTEYENNKTLAAKLQS